MKRETGDGKIGSMKARDQQRKPRREVGRVIRRLLSAVDRAIAAADEMKHARDELTRLIAKAKAGL